MARPLFAPVLKIKAFTPSTLPLLLQALGADIGLDPLPPALSGLSRLRLCHLEYGGLPANGFNYAPPLPGGSWLHSLQWLSVGIGTLLSSTAVLQAATVLECVSIANSHTASMDWGSPTADAFFDWLARHPPLLFLSLDAHWSAKLFVAQDFLVRIVQLCRRRPALLVQCPGWRMRETLFRITLRKHFPSE